MKQASGLAEMGCYPFEYVDWAHDKLWSAISSRAEWLPSHLVRTGRPEELWLSDDLVFSQSCGWPLITRLADKVTVVGAFRYSTPESVSHYYRNVIIARTDGTPFDFQGSVAAVNDMESLSGWISLVAAIHGPQESWTGQVVVSGSHYEDVQMLYRGEADVAAVDSVSLAHFRKICPEILEELFVIGTGPLVPSLPIITHKEVSPLQLAQLRRALSETIGDQGILDATQALFIQGFDSLDLQDYLYLRDLTPHY